MSIWVGKCCLCGMEGQIKHCPVCGHDFCGDCRVRYFKRGWEAFKALLSVSSLSCGGVKHG